MNKFNTQVSPGNRVDFSRIRKAVDGIKIDKVKGEGLTPDKKNRRLNEYGAKEDFFTNGLYDVDKMAEYYKSHPELFKDVDLSVITATPDWDNAKYDSKGFLDWNKQFNETGLNYFFGWNENDADYYGPTTEARRAFLNKISPNPTTSTSGDIPIGDLTTTSSTTTTETTIPKTTTTSSTIGTTDKTTTTTNGRKTLDFGKQFPARQGTPWTDWAPLSAILANNLINNQRVFNDEIKKKFPLKEAPYLQGKVTNNYAARQIREQLMVDARSRAQQLLGSDMTQNQQYLQAVEQNLQPLENQNAIDKTNEFNQTSQNLQEIENENKITGAEVANYNQVLNAAAFNNILAARQKLNTANTAELDSYIGNMTTSHGLWLQNERMEDARYNREINDYKYQTGLYNLYDKSGLKHLEGGIQNSNAFNTLREQIKADRSIKDITFGPNGEITDESLLEYIKLHPESPYVRLAVQAYQKELDIANSRFEHERSGLIAERTEANLRIPVTITNNGTRLGDRYIRHSIYLPRNPLYKSGGKVARFIDYMNHYQKLQLFDRREARKTQENLLRKLARDLDYLDKETLMLLKLIFK